MLERRWRHSFKRELSVFVQVARALAQTHAAGGSPAVYVCVIGGQNVRNNDALRLVVYLSLTPMRRAILHDAFLCFLSFI